MFRFTIRDLVWLTVVAALAGGWYVDRWSQWARGYTWYLKAEAATGELEDLIEGLETLPQGQLEEVREHLKKRRQVISSAGLNGSDGKALPSSQAPAPNRPGN